MRSALVVSSVLAVAAGCLAPTAESRRGIGIGGGSGAAATLSFTVQPSSVIRGQIITPAVQVTALDSLGRRDSSFTSNITVAIGSNPVGGNLGGARTVGAVAGVASFGDLTINRTGSGYTLTAAALGASGATSTAFSVSEPDASVQR